MMMLDSVLKGQSGGRKITTSLKVRPRAKDQRNELIMNTVYPSILGSLFIYSSIFYHNQRTPLHFIYLLHPLIPGVFTSPLVTESIHTSGWIACHSILSYGLDLSVLGTFSTSMLAGKGLRTLKRVSWFHSPGHTWGCAVRPGGHGGWRPTVRVRRSSRARWDRWSPSRRRWRPTGAWTGRRSRRSPAVWSWTGGWRPGGEAKILIVSKGNRIIEIIQPVCSHQLYLQLPLMLFLRPFISGFTFLRSRPVAPAARSRPQVAAWRWLRCLC